MENYSSKERPLIDLTKDVTSTCGHQPQQSFDKLRTRFSSAPILTEFDRTLQTIMETDASNQGNAGILSHNNIVNIAKQLHAVEYHAKTRPVAQRSCLIHNKELFAIVDCFRKCRDSLAGVKVNLYIEHQGLQYLNTSHKLNSHQAAWYLDMSEFGYNIHYRPGNMMGKSDGLSRCSGE